MKVIIAGGRSFNDYSLLKNFCDKILINQSDIEIVSGGAKGADALGERYAKERNYGLKIFLANWDKYGRNAGPIRNNLMSDYADGLIAFWDGESKGSKHMIDNATKKNLKVRICRY